MGALMPHAALWVVHPTTVAGVPHIYVVSMPHTALWVVQQL